MTEHLWPIITLFGVFLITLILSQVNRRLASPLIVIVNRWLVWAFVALGGAVVSSTLGLIDRPLWVLVTGFILIYFLLETGYRWLEIHALSVSPIPLFPRFQANISGEEWPTHPRLLKIRDWLRENGFRQVQSLKAEVGGGIYLRTSIYQDDLAQTRIQITFLPQGQGGISVCYSLSSLTASGLRYVTDNLYLPFGGFYPENWLVERLPWHRSLVRLMARHERRLAQAGEKRVPWTTEPLGDLNLQQRELEEVNTELGFLFPRAQREDHGKITYEGRYRVWKELWLLNYFGRAARYK
ncbi:MAG: hypothetical protein HS122_19110 [Opitutaceae bacterium]|nr:hypothetical protein [Opitutaceae bacterium]